MAEKASPPQGGTQRHLARDSTPRLSADTNVFDDQFASEDYVDSALSQPSVREDPFRSGADSDGSSSTQRSNLPSRSPSRHSQYAEPSSPVTARPMIPADATSDAQPTTDAPAELSDPNATPRRQSLAAHSITHRTLSSASSFSYAPPLSPAQGNSGPSHPYAMYPQGLGVSRSASVATTSTVRAPSYGRQTPAHPYSLYQQNVSGDTSEMSQVSIPAGFPGHGAQFHRRIGPEGEEGDIFGPDGHTEQLPPYSRYPDEFHTKIAGGGPLPAIGETLHGESSSSSQQSDRPMEMQERSRDQTTAATSSAAPGGEPAVEQQAAGETSSSNRDSRKTWSEMSWKERRRAKILGCLPLWALLFAIVVIAISAVVCGIVIGAVIQSNKGPIQGVANGTQPAIVTTTEYLDATPIPTPESAPPLIPDDYTVVFDPAYDKQGNACLIDPLQSSTWDCNMFGQTNGLVIQIGRSFGQPTLSTLSGPLDYGASIPDLDSRPLSWVKDMNDEANGPAYHFQTQYNKLVIIHEDDLTVTEHQARQSRSHGIGNRDLSASNSAPRRRSLDYADTPWFCWWNATFIEGFIYVNKPAILTTTPTPTPVQPSSSSVPESSNQPDLGGMQGVPTTDTASPDPATPTEDGVAGQRLPLGKRVPDDHDEAVPSPSPTPTRAPLPYLMKLSERRLGKEQSDAYCTKMSMGVYGQYRPITDTYGKSTIVSLAEQDPAPTEYAKRSNQGRGLKDVPLEGCFCQWEAA